MLTLLSNIWTSLQTKLVQYGLIFAFFGTVAIKVASYLRAQGAAEEKASRDAAVIEQQAKDADENAKIDSMSDADVRNSLLKRWSRKD